MFCRLNSSIVEVSEEFGVKVLERHSDLSNSVPARRRGATSNTVKKIGYIHQNIFGRISICNNWWKIT